MSQNAPAGLLRKIIHKINLRGIKNIDVKLNLLPPLIIENLFKSNKLAISLTE